MKHLKMPNGCDLCLLYSAAMVLDCSPREIVDCVGHEGQEQPWLGEGSDLRRNFHPQEIFDYARRRYAIHFSFIEARPALVPVHEARYTPFEIFTPAYARQRIKRLIKGQKGILTGITPIDRPHAIAWNDPWVYDPNLLAPIDTSRNPDFWNDFVIDHAFLVIKSI